MLALPAAGAEPWARAASRDEAKAALGIPAGRKVCLFMARPAAVKGPGMVLSAAAHLDGVVLVCAGGAPSKALDRAAGLMGLDVLQVGGVSTADRELLFSAADVLLLGSLVSGCGRGEGYPMVVREALARGLPVAALPSGGLTWDRAGQGLFLAGSLTPAGLAEAAEMALAFGRFQPVRSDGTMNWDTVADQVERWILA